MERISITQAKANWDELIARVEMGGRFVLTRWGRDKAILGPLTFARGVVETKLADEN